MSDSRIEWEILERDRIEVRINGRDVTDEEGKFIDTFTQKSFEVSPKELLTFQRAFTNMIFDWCNKFKCRLDEPVCH